MAAARIWEARFWAVTQGKIRKRALLTIDMAFCVAEPTPKAYWTKCSRRGMSGGGGLWHRMECFSRADSGVRWVLGDSRRSGSLRRARDGQERAGQARCLPSSRDARASRPGSTPIDGWPDGQDRPAADLRTGTTGPHLQKIHLTASTVGAGRREALLGVFTFPRGVRFLGQIRDKRGLMGPLSFEQGQQ